MFKRDKKAFLLLINKQCSFELLIQQRILKNIKFPQKYEAAKRFSKLLIIRNVS